MKTELRQLLVTVSELIDIEASARFFEDEDDFYILIHFLLSR